MAELLICVVFFYTAHLFFVMTFSLHKVPFVQFTISDGDLSGLTNLSKRMVIAGDNLRQSLFIFLPLSVLSIAQGIDNLFLAQIWFGLSKTSNMDSINCCSRNDGIEYS